MPSPAEPSTTAAGTAHATPLKTGAMSTHVHVDGHSASVLHAIVFTWQLDVGSVVVVQPPVGAGPASCDGIGALPVTPGATGVASAGSSVVPVRGAPVAGPPVTVPVPAAPPVTVPPPPDAQHVVEVSGTHVKWSPQSASTLQGSSYFGTHTLGSVTVVHVGGGGGGGHSSPLTHGADPAAPHDSYVSAWQTMPEAQSESAAQGPGWHVESVGTDVQTGADASHGPSARQGAGAGHVEMADGWHVKPLVQSPSTEHAVSARATPGVRPAPIMTRAVSEVRMD